MGFPKSRLLRIQRSPYKHGTEGNREKGRKERWNGKVLSSPFSFSFNSSFWWLKLKLTGKKKKKRRKRRELGNSLSTIQNSVDSTWSPNFLYIIHTFVQSSGVRVREKE